MVENNIEFKNCISRSSFINSEKLSKKYDQSQNTYYNDKFFTLKDNSEVDTCERVVRTSGSHNCGGRCVIKAHVKNERIVRISTEDDIKDTFDKPQLRGCSRCRSYRNRLYNYNRLKYPMKRVGKRGEGKFKRITWDEAIDIIADNIKRLMREYGPDSIYMNYATGNAGRTAERAWMGRLLGLNGGYLSFYGNYSEACTQIATPYTYGTIYTGNSRDDWRNSKLIILLGFNPCETIHGTNTSYYLKMAKKAGAKIICIDPIHSSTVTALADQWIPIRPTTDSALLDAMAYVIITENLQDQEFLNKYCIGFDEEHMSIDVPEGNSFKSYILGEGEDRTPKTPAWAENITGIPQDTITELAREYATNKPGALIQGFGPQRHAYGEQVVRSGTVLAAMTGNVGIKGGWASGAGYQPRKPYVASIPAYNPNKAKISVYCWPDAITHGKGMGADFSVTGVDKLNSNIKLIFNLAGNCLINQHGDSNGTGKILEDESLVEFIVVSDHFLTASAKYADILLPADNMMERDDIVNPWGDGDYVLYMNKAVETVFECRNGYDWISDLSKRLGLKEKFTEGKTLEDWLRYLSEETRAKNPGFPSYEEFKEKGIYRWEYDEPCIAFKEQIEDLKNNPFPTPSGKIEIFSEELWKKNNYKEIPSVPKYISAWEGPEDPLTEKYPLQCIGHHTKRRVHSIFDNTSWMEEVEKQAVWVNILDAEERDIKDGDLVKVFNDRGVIIMPVKVTHKIMPGVVSIPQGAWYSPDKEGIDRRGCVNTLTKYKPTPLAFGNPSHTALVQITKA